MTPTDEQILARDAFGTGESLVIEAGAGTGKTSTLVLLAESTGRRGQYLAFNKALVLDATGKDAKGKQISPPRFPEQVTAQTVHSLAWWAIVYGTPLKDRLDNSRRMSSMEIARALHIDPIDVSTGAGSDKRRLAPEWLAGRVMEAVGRFCQSADDAPGIQHFAYVEGLDLPDGHGKRTYTVNNEISRYLSPHLTRAWLDLCASRGSLRFEHRHYLKLAQLQGVRIPADYVMVDESQDIAPVMRAIVEQQAVQTVWVGDSNQEIYAWTGAQNALAQVSAEHACFLTQSFRFGAEIAAVANAVLSKLDTPLRLRGLESIRSEVVTEGGTDAAPDCILTRTNACSVRQVMLHKSLGRSVHLVGGGAEVLAFARAAEQLQTTGHTSHRELSCFTDWAAVQAYVSTDALGGELRLLVQLVDEFGVRMIEKALAYMPKETDAEVIVSTAHKAKGREWRHVKIADDFPPPKDGEVALEPAELRLLYVAATRAKNLLDISACPTLTAIIGGESA